MASPNLPLPLSTTISKATVSLGGQSSTHTFANPVQSYLGDQLFCHATSDGTILAITIDEKGPNSPAPAQAATIASITVNYHETPTPEHWDVQGIAYKAGSGITIGMQLDPTWATATLSIADTALAASTEAQLTYVLVRDDPDPKTGEQGHYDLYWLSTVALFDPDSVSGATFIPDGGGGMSGPFGISIP